MALHAAGIVVLGRGSKVRRGRPGEAERHGEVDVEHGLELLVTHVVDATVPRVARVVDDDVESAVRIECVLNEVVARVGRDEVADERTRHVITELRVQRPDGLVSLDPVDVGDDDARPVGGEHRRGTTADAAGAAGDDGDLSGQQIAPKGRFDEHLSPLPAWRFSLGDPRLIVAT